MIENSRPTAEEVKEKDNNRIDPTYYKKYPYEPIIFMENFLDSACIANCLKYLIRWKDKNGVEDLKKANTYLALFLKHGQRQTYPLIKNITAFKEYIKFIEKNEIKGELLLSFGFVVYCYKCDNPVLVRETVESMRLMIELVIKEHTPV